MVGNYGEFDKLCVRKLQKAKEKYPHIHIYSALAYYPQKINGNCLKSLMDSIFPMDKKEFLQKPLFQG